MQGVLVSPTLLNVIVYNFIHMWMALTVEYQRVALNGVGYNINFCMGVFNVDDSMVGSRDFDWLQHLMNVLVRFFRRYGLAGNISNSCTMTFQTGVLRSGKSEEDMERKYTGVGASYCKKLWRCTPCPECRVKITTGPITAHSC